MERWMAIALAAGLLWACGGGGEAKDAAEPGAGDATAGGEGAAEPAAGGEGAAEGQARGTKAPAKDKPSAREVLGVGPPETPWGEMSMQEREFYMIGKVLPVTKEMFQAHDPETYAGFGCESCHGEDMREREFAMPSPDLPAVPEPGSNAYESMKRGLPELVRFMEEDVTPSVQSMLGVETFTCHDCHPSA